MRRRAGIHSNGCAACSPTPGGEDLLTAAAMDIGGKAASPVAGQSDWTCRCKHRAAAGGICNGYADGARNYVVVAITRLNIDRKSSPGGLSAPRGNNQCKMVKRTIGGHHDRAIHGRAVEEAFEEVVSCGRQAVGGNSGDVDLGRTDSIDVLKATQSRGRIERDNPGVEATTGYSISQCGGLGHRVGAISAGASPAGPIKSNRVAQDDVGGSRIKAAAGVIGNRPDSAHRRRIKVGVKTKG